MNWKRFKNLVQKEKMDESYFILGIDIGNDSSAIAFYNASHKTPEIIDISGGYGKSSVPTVMQYIYETKEWVFGEYAVLNRGMGQEITLGALVEKLGRREYVEIDDKPVSVIHVLSLYLRELIGSIKQINPKAEIGGIVVAVPTYFSEEAKEELLRAFKSAGYEKELILLAPDRECILSQYFLREKPADGRLLLIDYGSREVRAGIYDMREAEQDISVKCLASLFDSEIGANEINNAVTRLFTEFYCLEAGTFPHLLSRQVQDQLSAFVYQHKDMLFQKSILHKPVKLYFNFVYPPFQRTVTKLHMEEVVDPYRDRFISFINNLLEKNVYDGKKINAGDIQAVLCTGGGFEMFWARDIVSEIFADSKVVFYKNSKAILAEGAAIMAAGKLDVADCPVFVMEDLHQTREDIGIRTSFEGRERFVPVVERNSFLWQKHPQKLLLLNEPTDPTVRMEILSRDTSGDMRVVYEVLLDGLPKRPKGVTKLSLSMEYLNFNEICVKIADYGFGELFPKSDYKKKISINLREFAPNS